MDYYKEFKSAETFHKENHKITIELKEKYKLQSKITSNDIGVTNGNTNYYGRREMSSILNQKNKEIGYIETFICKNNLYAYLIVSDTRNEIPCIFNKSYLKYFS